MDLDTSTVSPVGGVIESCLTTSPTVLVVVWAYPDRDGPLRSVTYGVHRQRIFPSTAEPGRPEALSRRRSREGPENTDHRECPTLQESRTGATPDPSRNEESTDPAQDRTPPGATKQGVDNYAYILKRQKTDNT